MGANMIARLKFKQSLRDEIEKVWNEFRINGRVELKDTVISQIKSLQTEQAFDVDDIPDDVWDNAVEALLHKNYHTQDWWIDWWTGYVVTQAGPTLNTTIEEVLG